ncbi:hypothetical protein SynA1544_01841 [Synechococcus sp. A15-44]|nr:hypothetical protein SynA1544_01841 [Synechococcus sp. A15-44]
MPGLITMMTKLVSTEWSCCEHPATAKRQYCLSIRRVYVTNLLFLMDLKIIGS